MLPTQLQPAAFESYPPEARTIAVAHIHALRDLPLAFLPGLLREVMDYDYKFPAERLTLDHELSTISASSPQQRRTTFRAFADLSLSAKLEAFDWVNFPTQFMQQESAHLWSTHQQDAFRSAATEYSDRMHASMPQPELTTRRLGIAVIGQGVDSYDGLLFRKLRAHGTYFSRVIPDDGLGQLLAAVRQRAASHPAPYAHWYIDGGEASREIAGKKDGMTCVSYSALEPVRAALLRKMQKQIDSPGMGPEELRTTMARLLPSDLGMAPDGDARLDRFQVRLLTEGSGTQIFSTTFAQWTARETLWRAQPLTMMVRFAPRQRQRPMNEMLSGTDAGSAVDATGSLVDADMGAYYQWINQQRLPGAQQSAFLVWFEGHRQAIAIAPSFPKASESASEMGLGKLLSMALA